MRIIEKVAFNRLRDDWGKTFMFFTRQALDFGQIRYVPVFRTKHLPREIDIPDEKDSFIHYIDLSGREGVIAIEPHTKNYYHLSVFQFKERFPRTSFDDLEERAVPYVFYTDEWAQVFEASKDDTQTKYMNAIGVNMDFAERCRLIEVNGYLRYIIPIVHTEDEFMKSILEYLTRHRGDTFYMKKRNDVLGREMNVILTENIVNPREAGYIHCMALDDMAAQVVAVYAESMGVRITESTNDRLLDDPEDNIFDEVEREIPENVNEPLIWMDWREKTGDIEDNSGIPEENEGTARQRGAEWFSYMKNLVIGIYGLGGLGSWFAVLCGRLRPKTIVVCDNDKVDSVNMTGQMYSYFDMGKNKVDAIAAKILMYNGLQQVIAINRRIEEDDIINRRHQITVCCFDNMAARRLAFNAWVKMIKNTSDVTRHMYLFIDARCTADFFQVYAMTGDDEEAIKKYQEKCLFSDEEAEETICSYKQTSYVSAMAGSVMTNVIVNFVRRKYVIKEGAGLEFLAPIPFETSYDASVMVMEKGDV